MNRDYYLGLDLGTASVGWAVTNSEYQIERRKGQAMWGTRLFSQANLAKDRRMARSSRRRLDRKKWRIQLLQEIFAEEINKIDDGFFHRLKESQYAFEDKRDSNGKKPDLPYALFVDKDYTDKDYHKQFKTIYHLRQYLMMTKETPDVRLIYLALHHMVKNRGHFLWEGTIDQVKDFKNIFEQFTACMRDEFDWDINCEYQEVENLFQEKTLTKNKKKEQLQQLFDINGMEDREEICKLLVGIEADFKKIFPELEESKKFNFSKNYPEDIEKDLGEKMEIINLLKGVYDWSVLKTILEKGDTISECKINLYEEHKKDLKTLKRMVKTYGTKEMYHTIFKEEYIKDLRTLKKIVKQYCPKDKYYMLKEEHKKDYKTLKDNVKKFHIKEIDTYIDEKQKNNYTAYIGVGEKQCTQEEFCAFLKKQLATIKNNIVEKDEIEIIQKIETRTLLPKQVSIENGVLPYQVHYYELEKMIDNLSKSVPLLAREGDKIKQIFKFHIPYYVGPLNGINGSHWVVRNSQEKIYPWNFEEVVNLEESAEKFIRRMTNKCTYLLKEDVLPKHSLLYSKFVVLNELNNLRLDGDKISVSLKKELYENLFEKHKKVTQKKLKDYLIQNGKAKKDVDITGIDGDFKGSLDGYHFFKQNLNEANLNEVDKEMIILNISLFHDDKKILRGRMSRMYPFLTEKQIEKICNCSFTGWGRLSKRFLEEIQTDVSEIGEKCNIIRALWETNENLMQLLGSKYSFSKEIEKENVEVMGHTFSQNQISYKILEDYSLSTAVKKQVWQGLEVVDEVCKIMGKQPKRLFLEVAREKQKSHRTVSRKAQLDELYESCKEEKELNELLKNENDISLRGKKIYLYYMQLGRCMYTGERIAFEDLLNNNLYDIDHIYPQSKVADDSFDNIVLVKKQINQNKSDKYPLEQNIRQSMRGFWKQLLGKKFISKEKYERLTRSNEFSDDELAGFIARQLVETRQSTKAIGSILKQILPETEIVYVKANNVSRFRRNYDFIKCREINDYHHAKDAYLNVVVGNAYYTKFGTEPRRFIENNKYKKEEKYNLKTMFEDNIINKRTGEVAWDQEQTIGIVRNTMQKNNILVSEQVREAKGEFFNIQPVKNGIGEFPLKGEHRLQDISKYGGYKSVNISYFVLVEGKEKGKTTRTLEGIPIYLRKAIQKDPKQLEKFLEEKLQIEEPKVLIRNIKIGTLFKINGYFMRLTGKSNNSLLFKNAMQLILSSKEEKIMKKIISVIMCIREEDKKNSKKDNKKVNIKDSFLSENDLNELYNTLENKLLDPNTIYYKLRQKTVKDWKKWKATHSFQEFNKKEKCELLYELLKLFQTKSGTANLKLMGLGKEVGKLTRNKNIEEILKKEYKEKKDEEIKVSLIYQSVLGFYEKEVEISKR